MDEAHKELVKILRDRDGDWCLNDAADALAALAGEVGRLKRELSQVPAWRSGMTKRAEAAESERDRLAGEVARIRVALDIEHDDLNPVTMAETWVNKARVLDDQVVSLLAERDRLKAALRLWQDAWATGRNEPMAIAANATKNELGDAS